MACSRACPTRPFHCPHRTHHHLGRDLAWEDHETNRLDANCPRQPSREPATPSTLTPAANSSNASSSSTTGVMPRSRPPQRRLARRRGRKRVRPQNQPEGSRPGPRFSPGMIQLRLCERAATICVRPAGAFSLSISVRDVCLWTSKNEIPAKIGNESPSP